MHEFDRKKRDPLSGRDLPLSDQSAIDGVLGTFFPNSMDHRADPEQRHIRHRASEPTGSLSQYPSCLPDAINPLRIGPLTFADRWDSVLTTLGSTTVTGIGAWISVQTAIALDPLHLAAGVAVTMVGLYFLRGQVNSGDLSWRRPKKLTNNAKVV